MGIRQVYLFLRTIGVKVQLVIGSVSLDSGKRIKVLNDIVLIRDAEINLFYLENMTVSKPYEFRSHGLENLEKSLMWKNTSLFFRMSSNSFQYCPRNSSLYVCEVLLQTTFILA